MVNKEKRPASAATENKASDKTLMSNYNKKKKEIQDSNGFPFVNEKGNPLKQCYENLEYLLNIWKYNIELNVITNRIRAGKMGKSRYYNNLDFLVVRIRSSAAKCGLTLGLREVQTYLQAIAEKNCFNPFANYLKMCVIEMKNDKNDYIGNVFDCFILNGDIKQDQKFLKKLFIKWLVGIAKLACNDLGKESGQGVLILQGPQGAGKTRFARWLMSADSSMVKTGEFIDPSSKDSVMKSLSCVLCELGEFGRTMTDKNRLKAFFTQNEDTYRPPYGMSSKTLPRRTSFLGTVNEIGFLIDETGERRYWVIALNSIDFAKLQKIEINKFWGQVKILADKGYEYWLNQEDIKQINQLSEQFKKLFRKNSY